MNETLIYLWLFMESKEIPIMFDISMMSCLGIWYDHESPNLLGFNDDCLKSQTFELLI